MKKLLAIILALVGLLAVLVGCGNTTIRSETEGEYPSTNTTYYSNTYAQEAQTPLIWHALSSIDHTFMFYPADGGGEPTPLRSWSWEYRDYDMVLGEHYVEIQEGSFRLTLPGREIQGISLHRSGIWCESNLLWENPDVVFTYVVYDTDWSTATIPVPYEVLERDREGSDTHSFWRVTIFTSAGEEIVGTFATD
ncbi:MAG: hypothetical protein FWC68_06040 [Oscillospiraceae bacterium]|nr:hypothetical protein [Oscillospiraceae bacterium]